ncbi:CDP-diacylglycerol--serine O-phosphatidyltransferase [Salipaludibacillus sp. CUR1]|uniref:CDP-diacylglycerol--serine O-phosphatidyltransferase n=1 Tax=Salipaludibacillus sp. CUR1 TaxID=2820003 RepID=UPI001E34E227|nr:CDP-diacylglycerol--serine O-phosphatidyltransferase [Salipaludibacillus sp. CUR1]MCE7794160.1 CDP-diacylglycerol--serine O-phosphatidyltransferase [Salipaludibacillus sp. CUR1]
MILFQHLVDNTVKCFRTQAANVLTITNLGFGGFAILFVLEGQLGLTVAFICLAAILDFLDGKVARKMNIESDVGKQLDSLCDMISFGVAPALLVYHSTLQDFGMPGSMAVIIFIACGAIRLARFNISEQSGFFIGLPITAAGCLLTLSYLFKVTAPPVMMFIILTLSLLMISHFRVKKV